MEGGFHKYLQPADLMGMLKLRTYFCTEVSQVMCQFWKIVNGSGGGGRGKH